MKFQKHFIFGGNFQSTVDLTIGTQDVRVRIHVEHTRGPGWKKNMLNSHIALELMTKITFAFLVRWYFTQSLISSRL